MEKDILEFKKDNTRFDGLDFWCKKCRESYTQTIKNTKKFIKKS